MKQYKEKAVIGYRVDSTQANTAAVAETLGITPEEMQVVVAYVNVLAKRIEAAAVAPITAEAETHIRKKFPNNDEAVEAVNQTKIVDEATKFVEDSVFGFPIGNLSKPAPIDKAKTDFAQASMRCISSPGDTDRQLGYAKALRWLAKMRVQQAYKDALSPVLELVHHERRGYKWIAPDQTVGAVSADDTLKLLTA
jgi:hypothetical protein